MYNHISSLVAEKQNEITFLKNAHFLWSAGKNVAYLWAGIQFFFAVSNYNPMLVLHGRYDQLVKNPPAIMREHTRLAVQKNYFNENLMQAQDINRQTYNLWSATRDSLHKITDYSTPSRYSLRLNVIADAAKIADSAQFNAVGTIARGLEETVSQIKSTETDSTYKAFVAERTAIANAESEKLDSVLNMGAMGALLGVAGLYFKSRKNKVKESMNEKMLELHDIRKQRDDVGQKLKGKASGFSEA